MKNTNGLDADYFKGKLALVVDGIYNYTPPELARELARLAKTSDDVAASEVTHPPAQPDTALKARIVELESELDDIRFTNHVDELERKVIRLKAQIAAQAGQEHVAWADCERISDTPIVAEALENFSMDATADNAICLVTSILSAAQPAPANSIAIVQAALEAAAIDADEWAMEYVDHDHAPYTVGAKIRASDPQLILDGVGK